MNHDAFHRSADSINAPAPSNPLLDAQWRSPDLTHQISAFDRAAHRFENIPIKSISEAVRVALALSNAGIDTYFACAEYLTPENRTAANASGACAFWLDIDCGPDKYAEGKGYTSVDDARLAIERFCNDVALPLPTHIVHSGSGLHVYWALDALAPREQWQASARKLKRLTRAHGLLADDSRTSDIASLLRIPGTRNFKYEPPRPVSLAYSSEQFIEQATMLRAIASAHEKLGSDPSIVFVSAPGPAHYGPPDLARLASALAVLDPDCDEQIWKIRRLAPLAHAARQYRDYADVLYALARAWSCGELRGKPSKAWSIPGGNGLTGEEAIDEAWERFLSGKYSGIPITVGTIYHDAAQAGWTDPECFKKINDAGEGDA